MTSEIEYRCVVCKSPIYEGASKCIECGSYQNQLRQFLTSLDVKSLIALIPIATLSFVFIKDQLITPRSDLNIASLSCQIDTVTVAAANLGDRDALFAGVDLIRKDDTTIKMSFASIPKTELLVPAGKTKIYEVKAADSEGVSLGLNLSEHDPCDFRLRVRALEFEQTASNPHPICACPQK